MTVVALYVAGAVLTLVVLFFFWRAIREYRKFRGQRLVTCPETRDPATVHVDAVHAASTGAFGKTRLQVESCSRWPARRNCGQECLAEIEAAPQDCLVRTILTRWYAVKSCFYCGKPLSEMHWLEHKPTLMSPDRTSFEWADIPAQNLPEVLATHKAVCWNCHIAESFRRRYPHLVVDRPWKPGDGLRSR